MSLPAPLGIRPARPADALCLGALATQVFFDTYATSGINPDLVNEAREHCSAEVFSRRLGAARVEIDVAELGGNLVGFIDVQHDGACPVSSVVGPEVLRLYIQRPFQGQGLGRALLRHAEDRAMAQGEKALWLTAWVGNTRAVGFYPQAGYGRVGAMQYIISGKAYENHVFAKRLQAGGA